MTHETAFWHARGAAIRATYKEIALDREPVDMEWHLRALAAKLTDASIAHTHAITTPPPGFKAEQG